ncbi:MAG: hypothetical protein J6S85_06705 [Methanobrevibacter sp.]|nr:hypothetical protein [Methanobrevibacter sp.]
MNNIVKAIWKLFAIIKRFIVKNICWLLSGRSNLNMEKIDLFFDCMEAMNAVDNSYHSYKNKPTYKFSQMILHSGWNDYLDIDREFLPFIKTIFSEIKKVEDLKEKENLFNKIVTRFNEVRSEYEEKEKPRPKFFPDAPTPNTVSINLPSLRM